MNKFEVVMHSYRVQNDHNKWFCMITYVWQDPQHPEFREQTFGPFNSEEDANKWGQEFIEETWSYFERNFK